MTKPKILAVILILSISSLAAPLALAKVPPPQNPQNGNLGLEGTVQGSPPTQAATITTPVSGRSFTTLPITVAGLCPGDLLVEIFTNNVFAGSVQCKSGSYSLQVDLFSGQNDLVARVFDSLNQQGPDSATVSVTFNDNVNRAGPRISLLSAYAKRGAQVGSELTWPITISGGTSPYAVSVDWGDRSTEDLLSQKLPGDFAINHTYANAGTYSVIIKATDANGDTAFLQVVGIGNGQIQQASNVNAANNSGSAQAKQISIAPLVVLGALVVASFWIGRRHQMAAIRNRLKRGERPF